MHVEERRDRFAHPLACGDAHREHLRWPHLVATRNCGGPVLRPARERESERNRSAVAELVVRGRHKVRVFGPSLSIYAMFDW